MIVQQPLAPRAPVGSQAPTFQAEAYFPEQVQVGTISSQDLSGRWVLLLFYSSDFTFV